MSVVMDVNKLLEDAKNTQNISRHLANSFGRMVSTYQSLDPASMREAIKSMYHMNWNLKDLHNALPALTRLPADDTPTTADDVGSWPEIQTIEDAHERAIEIYRYTQQVAGNLDTTLRALRAIGAEERTLNFLNARIFLDLHFLRKDLEAVTGRTLPQ